MNIIDIKNSAKYIQSSFKCEVCKAKYHLEDIYLLATAEHEGLFEMRCHECESVMMVTIVNVLKEQQFRFSQRVIKTKLKGGTEVNKDDLLDIKNFLNSNFDGNFKKLFEKPKK
ncbi:MAG: hypothetical protein RBS56_02500 [Candidatus Gracilibacteria bacterium]|jgi:hypothetical protein|nr:hypothetical protein [Candidatus Gracilibacteria bacterium]